MILDNKLINCLNKLIHLKRISNIRIFLVGSYLIFSAFTSSFGAERHVFEAELAKPVSGATKVSDAEVFGGYLMSLTKTGQGIRFAGLPASGKLAIRYASQEAGTISIAVNNQLVHKVNVHSSGALTGSFLNAVIDVAIPSNVTLAIMLESNDAAVNIDHIIVGDGDIGLPPDIWNLPPLTVAAGPYPADWKGLSRLYTVPEW